MCAIVFYKKRIGGQLYPKAARTGPYAFAQEVKRVNGRVVAKYLGILRVPEGRTIGDGPEANITEKATAEKGDGGSKSLLEFLSESVPRETDQATK